MAFLLLSTGLGGWIQYQHGQTDAQAAPLNAVFYVGTQLLDILIIVLAVSAASVFFWKWEQQWMGVLLALTLICYWTSDSTPLDFLTKPEFNPWVAFFRPPILTLRAASLALALTLLFTFPDGQFRPRWTRWLALGYAGLSLAYLLLPDLPTNTVYGATWRRTPELSFAASCAPFVVGIYAQVYRYRRAAPEQRNQLKWTALGLLTMVAGVMLYYGIYVVYGLLLPPTSPDTVRFGVTILQQIVQVTLAVALPVVCFMIAIFRHQLWPADPVIHRVLVYTALTGTITLIYLVGVVLIGALFSTTSFVISVPVTVIVVLAFQPLHNLLRRVVDRLMFGERNDPYRVIARVGEQVQSGGAQAAVVPMIAETLLQALQVPYVEIRLASEPQPAVVRGRRSELRRLLYFPLRHGDEEVGEIVLGQDEGDRGLTAAERELVENIARQTAIVLHAIQLNAKLQHSRQSIVSAREEERRRLRRDLHDGAGPTLAALHLKAGALRASLVTDGATADAQLLEMREQIRSVIADIRRVVYDLRPPTLDELGLALALREQATQYALGGLRMSVDTPDTLGPLPAAVEVAAYRIALEALTNVLRHAAAQSCGVRLARAEDLVLEVWDDGRGLPAEHQGGMGLTSMRERAAELGGTCLVEPRPGGGTRVLARLPLAPNL